jgi:hypothetical protein
MGNPLLIGFGVGVIIEPIAVVTYDHDLVPVVFTVEVKHNGVGRIITGFNINHVGGVDKPIVDDVTIGIIKPPSHNSVKFHWAIDKITGIGFARAGVFYKNLIHFNLLCLPANSHWSGLTGWAHSMIPKITTPRFLSRKILQNVENSCKPIARMQASPATQARKIFLRTPCSTREFGQGEKLLNKNRGENALLI